jgi:hypothetical protein
MQTKKMHFFEIKFNFHNILYMYTFRTRGFIFRKTVVTSKVTVPLCFITVVQRLGKTCIPVWTPSLLMCLITQITSLDTSSMFLERFPRSGFFNFGNKSKSGGLSPRLAQTLDHCAKPQWSLHWRPVNVFCKINSFLKRKHTVCRTSEMTNLCVYMYDTPRLIKV